MNKNSTTLKYLLKLLHNSTPYCKHQDSCLINMSKGFAIAFLKAFVAKLCLNAVLLILSSKKIMKSNTKIKLIFNILINKTNFRLGIFMGLQTFLIKSLQCSLRKLRNKEDGWNAAISGFIAGGISFITQAPHVQNILRVYLFSRAVDCLYQLGIQKNYYRSTKIIPALAFIGMTSIICYAFFFEPDILPMDTFKMYENFSQQTLVDQIWHMCNVQQYRNRVGC